MITTLKLKRNTIMLKKTLLGCALLLASTSVMALPMMKGAFSIEGVPENSATANKTTNAVSFSPDTIVTSGAYGSFTDGMAGTINDFGYNDTTGALSIPDLFTVGNFIFDLNTIAFVSEFAPEFVTLVGYGTMRDTSNTYENTVFKWAFNTTGNGSWSASVVPEPAALALLGFGLLGMTLVRRNKKAA